MVPGHSAWHEADPKGLLQVRNISKFWWLSGLVDENPTCLTNYTLVHLKGARWKCWKDLKLVCLEVSGSVWPICLSANHLSASESNSISNLAYHIITISYLPILSIWLSVDLYVHLILHIHHLTLSVVIYLSVYLLVSPSPSISLPIYLSVYLPTNLSVCPSTSLSICPSIYRPIDLPAYLV